MKHHKYSERYQNGNIHILFIFGLIVTLSYIGCEKPQPVSEKAVPDISGVLEAYVRAEDPAFHYEVMHQSKEEGYTFVVLKMVSQKWLSAEEVNEPTWWHWVSVVVPDTINKETGMMFIGGGSSDDDMPQEGGALLIQPALLTQSVTASIHNIPFQPLTFSDDDREDLDEDEIIAYGWKKFLEGGARDEDAAWLARLPMTKAVVRGMDAVSDLVSKEFGYELNKYVVAGASKRGWTTWTTAAVDNRVVAIAPLVIDLLNIVPSFEHHWRNYGFWAPAVNDYVEQGIMDWMGSAEFDRMLEMTEPYSFVSRYTMPKYLINASGDQFFLPDSWQFYWSDLKEEKHLRYVPNTGHSLENSDVMASYITFYASVVNGWERPEYTWNVSDSSISVTVDPENPPRRIALWQGSVPGARDFRIDVAGDVWVDKEIPVNSDGRYDVQITAPAEGYTGYFVELTYEIEEGMELKVTSGTKILPDAYSFSPYQSEVPMGSR